MEWTHIKDRFPEEEDIIRCFPRSSEGHYTMGIGKWICNDPVQYRKECEEHGYPDFWWTSAKDFPFPDKDIGDCY